MLSVASPILAKEFAMKSMGLSFDAPQQYTLIDQREHDGLSALQFWNGKPEQRISVGITSFEITDWITAGIYRRLGRDEIEEGAQKSKVGDWVVYTRDVAQEDGSKLTTKTAVRKSGNEVVTITYSLPLSQKDEAEKGLLEAIRGIKKIEQTSAGQTATRPESKSEGSDKPQPESEGRSR